MSAFIDYSLSQNSYGVASTRYTYFCAPLIDKQCGKHEGLLRSRVGSLCLVADSKDMVFYLCFSIDFWVAMEVNPVIK